MEAPLHRCFVWQHTTWHHLSRYPGTTRWKHILWRSISWKLFPPKKILHYLYISEYFIQKYTYSNCNRIPRDHNILCMGYIYLLVYRSSRYTFLYSSLSGLVGGTPRRSLLGLCQCPLVVHRFSRWLPRRQYLITLGTSAGLCSIVSDSSCPDVLVCRIWNWIFVGHAPSSVVQNFSNQFSRTFVFWTGPTSLVLALFSIIWTMIVHLVFCRVCRLSGNDNHPLPPPFFFTY